MASQSFTVTSDHNNRHEGDFLSSSSSFSETLLGFFSETCIRLVVSVLLFTLWSQAACNVLCLCKTAGQKGTVLSPLDTFSTDLEVSAVYQVKTPERAQAGNLNKLIKKKEREKKEKKK